MSTTTARTGVTRSRGSARRLIATALTGLALASVTSSDASATGGPTADQTIPRVPPPRPIPQPCDSIMVAGVDEPPTLRYRECPPFTWPAPCAWVSPLGGYDAAQRYPAPCPDAAVTRPGD